jgi:CBS domain-containing protein
MSTTIRQMLTQRAQVISVGPTAKVLDALKLMADLNVGAVLIIDGGRLVGIFSERDYARKVVLKGKASADTAVSDVMTSSLITIDPGWTADQAMVLMDEKHIRHLPVIEGDRVLGVISIRDVVHAVIAEQRFTIKELEKYISS